jgi:hypothetical protein
LEPFSGWCLSNMRCGHPERSRWSQWRVGYTGTQGKQDQSGKSKLCLSCSMTPKARANCTLISFRFLRKSIRNLVCITWRIWKMMSLNRSFWINFDQL